MDRSIITMHRRRFALAIAALAGLHGLCVPAQAQAETQVACVRCSGPDQTYRCRAMSDDSAPSEALRYFCMSQIAREHVHESCGILRSADSCNGVDVSYVYQDEDTGQPAQAQPGDAGEPKEPGTLADMTRSTVQASVKAGKAVGDATVRTLKCLGSALNGC